jgi:hypothetical protein
VEGELIKTQATVEREEIGIYRSSRQKHLHLQGSVHTEHESQVGKQLQNKQNNRVMSDCGLQVLSDVTGGMNLVVFDTYINMLPF